MKPKFCIFFLCGLLSVSVAQATLRKVLFIGNSYTYTNSMPNMLQSFATAKGDTMLFAQSDPGGYTLAQHAVYAPTITAIFSQQWDIVVIQEQSELPSFPPAEVDTEVYPYAHILDSMVLANDSCTQTMFMMTWGHANGDPANCAAYPVICTYEGMQSRLRESYMQMAQDNNAIVAPVGAAWKVAKDSFPSIWLYMPDSSHPLVSGSYLETCVLYASIFHKPATGCTYLAALAPADAASLQYVADKVVLDSLSQWQQHGHYPTAMFSSSVSNHTVTYTSQSPVPVSQHGWSFGDAATDNAANPVHIYTQYGAYAVAHSVSNNCFSETIVDTVHVGATGLSNVASPNQYLNVFQGNEGTVTFAPSASSDPCLLEIYGYDGRMLGRYPLGNEQLSVNLLPGLYVYRTYGRHGAVRAAKFVVQ